MIPVLLPFAPEKSSFLTGSSSGTRHVTRILHHGTPATHVPERDESLLSRNTDFPLKVLKKNPHVTDGAIDTRADFQYPASSRNDNSAIDA